MSENVVHPVEREPFAGFVEHALTTRAPRLFERMLREGSPLFDEGLVDPDSLREVVERLRSFDYKEERASKVLEVLSLHMCAEAALGH